MKFPSDKCHFHFWLHVLLIPLWGRFKLRILVPALGRPGSIDSRCKDYWTCSENVPYRLQARSEKNIQLEPVAPDRSKFASPRQIRIWGGGLDMALFSKHINGWDLQPHIRGKPQLLRCYKKTDYKEVKLVSSRVVRNSLLFIIDFFLTINRCGLKFPFQKHISENWILIRGCWS